MKSGESDAPEERNMRKDGCLTVLEEGIAINMTTQGGADHRLVQRCFSESLTPWFSASSFAPLDCLDLPWAFYLQVTLQGLFELKNSVILCLELRVV